jgi:FkbM family methyltransferase
MSFQSTIRRWVRKVTWIGFTVFDLQLRRRSLSEHADVFADLRTLVAGTGPIFDVGARSGSTAFGLHSLFPAARIECFEPARESFQLLEERFRSVPQVHCHHSAVAESSGTRRLQLSRTDSTNSLLDAGSEFGLAVDPRHVEVVGEEVVEVVTLDDFCKRESIEHIDLVKLDIQGAEMLALRGAERLLADGAIDAILAEVSFFQLYESQSLAWEIQAHLEARGYHLFGLYDLTHGRNGMLAWGDALFVSAPLAERLKERIAQPEPELEPEPERSARTAS